MVGHVADSNPQSPEQPTSSGVKCEVCGAKAVFELPDDSDGRLKQKWRFFCAEHAREFLDKCHATMVRDHGL